MQRIICLVILITSHLTSFSQSTILWKITKSDSRDTSYLLGTYHQIGNSFVDSLPAIRNALFSSNLAIFESTDTGEKVREYLNSRRMDSVYLTQLKKSDVQFLQTISADWAVPIGKLKPMELLTKLQQVYFETQCGSVKPTDTWNHFDNYLIHLAHSKQIPIMGLETDSLQTANVTASAPDASWNSIKKPIHTWIKNIADSKHTEEYCHYVREYMRLSFNYQFDQKCGENPMVKGRNMKWMEILPALIEKNNCFIAVGLMHLYGDCGLIVQLRDLGYTVSEVPL